MASVACLTILTVLSGCDPKDKTPNPITVADGRQLEQTVFADKTSGASTVNINTTGAWTSTIAEKAQTKENAPSPAPAWISISPDRGDKAGNYPIAITLKPNYTGADRTAIVTISCLGATVTVTVTQRATKDDGTKYEWFNRTITGHIVNGNNVAEVKLMVEVAQVGLIELANTTCLNGDFTIVLPDTVNHEFLSPDVDDMPNTIQISDRRLHILDIPWFTADSVELFFGSDDGKVEAALAYVDRDATVTGYVQEEDTRIEYDWDLKAGWNWVYVTYKDATTISYSTTKPDVELHWVIDNLTRRR